MSTSYEPVPLLRCHYLDLAVSAFRDLGHDVTSELIQSRLPAELPKCRGAYVPALPTFDFITSTVQQHNIEDFGCLAGAQLKVSDFDAAVRRELNKARTLSEALNSYCRLVSREQSHVLCHVTEHISGEAQIYGTVGLGLGPDQHEYSEWLLIMSLLAIVRHAAGSDWRPSQVAFQSQPAFGKSVWKAFPGTRFVVSQCETCVTVPAEILSLAWPDGRETAKTRPMPAELASSRWDFPSSLRSAIRPYLADGYPTVELAAELAGMSVRTLQRRLNQCRLSYSDLIKHLRFEVASDLLADPRSTVIDAACEVGFSDPSHFSRAFRQMAGVSPREFRRQRLAA